MSTISFERRRRPVDGDRTRQTIAIHRAEIEKHQAEIDAARFVARQTAQAAE